MRFEMICAAKGIEHRATKPNHSWTNGQVGRVNRTIKQATVKRYHYDAHDQPRRQVVHDYLPAKAFRSMLGPPDVRCRDEKKKKSRSNCPQLAGEHGQKTCVARCYRVHVSGRAIRCHVLTACGPHWASLYPAAGGGKKVNWTVPAGRQFISKPLGPVLAEATKFFAFRDSVEKAQPSKIMIHRRLDELIWISWDVR